VRPRVAVLGFSIECNRFAPVATRTDFHIFQRGAEILDDARSATPRALPEAKGFVDAMNATGAWLPVPILLAQAPPNGPVEEGFFREMMAEWQAGLEAEKPDAVYLVLHGAGMATHADSPDGDDPDGALIEMARRVVGPNVPIVATLDLHANVSRRMVAGLDAFIGYRTNPHLDMLERGAEAAHTLRLLLAGTKTHLFHIRLPIIAPSVTQVTLPNHQDRPMGEVIDFGQARREAPLYAGKILNVSVMGGFAHGDTADNGFSVIVTATDARAAHGLCVDVAEAAWARRQRFRAKLTSVPDAVAMAKQAPSRIFADVGDNPGGGGRGNTLYILDAFLAGGVQNALLGALWDPPLAAAAHKAGMGGEFTAELNTHENSPFSARMTRKARVIKLSDGKFVGRRGIFANQALEMGPTAAIAIDGITVVVISVRQQCADPMFFEHLGLDIAAASAVVVKSRGHFRGGFDEFFPAERIIDVGAPGGLTSLDFAKIPWTRLPRPSIPLDEDAPWTPPPFTQTPFPQA
jgi:microcystin degradation protein MlrC